MNPFLAHMPEGGKLGAAPKGKSYDKAYQNQEPAGYNIKRVSSGAGRDGLKVKTEKVPYYNIEKPKTVTKTVYKDKPVAAPPKPAPKPKAPVEHSPEIQQAKDRVNSYEKDILSGKTSEDIYGKSPWEQAQATVQSSYIKPTSSNPNEQIDFSADTFEAKESSEPNEQAQAAQTQMQNYISKYSQFKSSI
jgi:hypothetical protein